MITRSVTFNTRTRYFEAHISECELVVGCGVIPEKEGYNNITPKHAAP